MTDPTPEDFESSLLRLQQLVQQLESGEAGLEASLKLFEEGTRLLRNCYQRLEQVDQRIEILTGFDSAGNPLSTPFDATSTLDQGILSPGDSVKKPARRRSPRKMDSPHTPDGEDQAELPF